MGFNTLLVTSIQYPSQMHASTHPKKEKNNKIKERKKESSVETWQP